MSERIRLDKLLSNMGLGSRKAVKALIKGRAVTVNGAVCTTPETLVDTAEAVVTCNGQALVYEKFCYLMLNKPAGYVSANEDRRDPTVMALLPEPYCNLDLFVAGRLDKDTEGLLILTNDGQFAHNMLSPKKHVPKTYFAQIAGRVTPDDSAAFAQGVTLDDGYQTLPAELTILHSGTTSEILLTLHEGKFHQVKRMFESRGHRVLYLERRQIGALSLDENLARGQVKKLSPEEVASIGAEIGGR